MHPLGLYLAITEAQRDRGGLAVTERRASFARVDALPIVEPEPVSRIARLAAILRRRVMRSAGA
jgi:hypothetical protein